MGFWVGVKIVLGRIIEKETIDFDKELDQLKHKSTLDVQKKGTLDFDKELMKNANSFSDHS